MTAQMHEAMAADVLDHPGFKDLLADVTREARAARATIFDDTKTEKEQSFARGSLKVLYNVVASVFTRANKEMPDSVRSLFE